MLATEYAQWHGIEKQGENESDTAFQSRVSGALRDAGNIIEAHEVAQNKRFDAEGSDMVRSGIMGAVAMAISNTNYGRSGSSLVGDEIAAGVVAGAKKRDDSAMLMLAMLMMSRD